MAVVGTTGVLAGMGASSAARSIATVAPLSSPATVSRGIGQVNATRLETAQAYDTSSALQDANQAIGTLVFNAATAHTADADFLTAQAPALNRWYVQQSQVAPAQFLSQARQNRIITAQQYQALTRDPRAQGEFAEAYKLQLNAISERDALGNLTPEGLGKAANLRSGMENAQAWRLMTARQETAP
ncbi:MAG: hypothetical protein OK456_09365, partial [Thaumarchaeota archaeon]|nr:hypothetical protein [Nitrososphaerota archaeon]